MTKTRAPSVWASTPTRWRLYNCRVATSFIGHAYPRGCYGKTFVRAASARPADLGLGRGVGGEGCLSRQGAGWNESGLLTFCKTLPGGRMTS